MKINPINLLKVFCFVLAGTTSIQAQDWPQFLGPEGNSTSPQKNLLREWPENGPEVLWTTDVQIGFGGPVVKDGKVYMLDREDKYGDHVRCFDLNTGAELWKYSYESPGEVEFPGSRSVPAVDYKYVYSCGQNGELYCIDINTHEPVWTKNVWTDFGGEPAKEGEDAFAGMAGGTHFPMWGIAQCPLIYGDLLIVASQTPEVGVVAYNKETGDVVWKTPSLGTLGYVSPAIAKVDGEDQVVMITASSGGFGGGESKPSNVVGIDPKNGEVLWTYSNWSCWIPSSSAFDAGENKVLIVGGYRSGAAMLQIEKSGTEYKVNELFKTSEFGEHTKPPLSVNGYFYAQFSNNETRDGLVCMNSDGEIMWKTKRNPAFNKGSMILADGLILATDGETTLYLIEPDPTGFKQLASATILTESGMTGNERVIGIVGTNQNWAPIALADGKLLIKGQRQMVCLKVAE
nr:PQQ-binding-like beta-propeller repeat protein [uncultured Draconibacterium sp.]